MKKIESSIRLGYRASTRQQLNMTVQKLFPNLFPAKHEGERKNIGESEEGGERKVNAAIRLTINGE